MRENGSARRWSASRLRVWKPTPRVSTSKLPGPSSYTVYSSRCWYISCTATTATIEPPNAKDSTAA
eukprot:6609036-Pyramimonas_sp.AAC.1